MKPQHTPGAWHIFTAACSPDQRAIGDETENRIIALIDKSDEQDEANAHLIAAAPELLEALENLVRNFTQEPDPHGDLKKAKAVIKKAKGE